MEADLPIRAAPSMRIAYFINQYPKVSHTFIRREIQALEAMGLRVERFALRSPAEELVDPRISRNWTVHGCCWMRRCERSCEPCWPRCPAGPRLGG
jgi:hypothetical protein